MPIRDCSDDLIAYLNGLLALDPQWVTALVQFRPPCNVGLANHPTLQAVGPGEHSPGGTIKADPERYTAGVLGLLNGFCGVYDDGEYAGWGPVAARFEGGRVVAFERADCRPMSDGWLDHGKTPVGKLPIPESE